MKRRPYLLLLACLKINFRKLKRILLVFFLLNCIICYSQDIELNIETNEDELSASISLNYEESYKVINSLQDGLEAEIIFEFRVYEKEEGFFTIIGDKLIIEEKTSSKASMNFFENSYNIITSENIVSNYITEEDFLINFFKKKIIRTLNVEMDKKYYIQARVQLNHVKLKPPLDLILFFYQIGFTSDWVEKKINIW